MSTLAHENRELPEEMVLDFIRDAAPEALPFTKLVGQWLWVMFPAKPDESTLPRARTHSNTLQMLVKFPRRTGDRLRACRADRLFRLFFPAQGVETQSVLPVRFPTRASWGEAPP